MPSPFKRRIGLQKKTGDHPTGEREAENGEEGWRLKRARPGPDQKAEGRGLSQRPRTKR